MDSRWRRDPPQEVAIGCSPDQYQPIFTGAGNERAIRGPHGSIDHCGMFTSHPAGAFLHIPETYNAIIPAAGKPTAIWAPVHTGNRRSMALQDMCAGPPLGHPDAPRLIIPAARSAVCD